MILIVLLGLILPRAVTAVLYLFSNWFTGVFETWYWPILGFTFMPYTLLWYSAVQNWYNGAWGTVQGIVLIVAILFDLSSYKKARG